MIVIEVGKTRFLVLFTSNTVCETNQRNAPEQPWIWQLFYFLPYSMWRLNLHPAAEYAELLFCTDCMLSGLHFILFALKNLQGGEMDASGSDFSPCCAMQMFSTCLSDLLRKSLCDHLWPGPVLGIVCQIPPKVGKVNLFKDYINKSVHFLGEYQ